MLDKKKILENKTLVGAVIVIEKKKRHFIEIVIKPYIDGRLLINDLNKVLKNFEKVVVK